jgi:thioredoxin reductase
MAEAFDVLIIGGGPAGQAAALRLSGRGLSIGVVDEQLRPGGQILRQPPATFGVANWMAGRTYRPLRRQLSRFEATDDINWLGGRSVLGISRGTDGLFGITLAATDGATRFTARRVLIAAGCQDLAVPLPGWTLPGVYSAGGLQAFVKSQQIIPGDRLVLAGTHPLQLLIAAQIVEAGGKVAAVLFAQPRSAMLGALAPAAGVVVRHAATFAPAIAALRTLKRHGVAVRFGTGIDAVLGHGRVQAVAVGAEAIACDAVGLCFGFVPQSALPRMLGATVRPAGYAGGWAATHDRWMRASITGLYVAGETTGVAGAPAAMAAGKIAGAGIALDLGLIDEGVAEAVTTPARARHARLLRFAALLERIADPRRYFPAIGADTLVCRCEDVPLGGIAPLIGTSSANSVKLASRCGMGVCQGRNCEPTLLRLLDSPADPGFTARFPARPATIAELASPNRSLHLEQ